MVECHLAKVKVAGPNPVSRSTNSRQGNNPTRRDEDPQGSYGAQAKSPQRKKRIKAPSGKQQII